MSHIVPDKDSGIGDSPGPINSSHEEQSHLPGTEAFQILPRLSIRELNSQERETAISRYKEKKKTRRYIFMHHMVLLGHVTSKRHLCQFFLQILLYVKSPFDMF